MVLDAIVGGVRTRLEERRRVRPLAELYEGLAPSERSFDDAVRRPAPVLILEVKPSSPSRGVLRKAADLGPVLDAYRQAADVVSVLTEPAQFGGSFELLRAVRRALPQPVLCKDFIVDPYQVVEARYHGADAVLLMLSVLDNATYRACAAAARELGMGVLTEVHDADEMRRAAVLGAGVIGINNRDLRTMRVDLTVTRRLAPLAPPGARLVAESGVNDRRDLESLLDVVPAFLVGSALMQSGDPMRAAHALRHGETKVCGLTRGVDARAAEAAGFTHGGIVFHEASPRCVSGFDAPALVGAAPLQWVGVFVNEAPQRIGRLARSLGLAAVQLHGEETAATMAAVREAIPSSCELWKAVPVRDLDVVGRPDGVDLALFDTWDRQLRGGTGRTFDWSVLGGVQGAFAIAGGLTPGNVAGATARGARLIDVSSGVEVAPGRKDHERLAAFMAARRAGPRGGVVVPRRERVA